MSYCPYFDPGCSLCNFFSTYQDGDRKENYCLSSSNWKGCLNYSNRSYEEKVAKRLRSNPDL
jgi:hypothetical protein